VSEECGCEFTPTNVEERRTLIAVLAINAVMFVLELVAGIWSESTGLVADSLDMFADASVYSVSLYAVGRHARIRQRAATASGILQIGLGLLVLGQVLYRTAVGSEPISGAMVGVGAIALVANTLCLKLLAKHRHGDVNLRASWVFSANDVLANLGVMISGGLVWLTRSQYPDLLIGLVIAAIVIRGGISIIADARRDRLQGDA